FWLAAAVATLVKGPLGIVLAGLGLFAALWEMKSGARAPIRGSHWAGIGLYLLICGGWFALAYRKEHGDLVQKMLFKELFTHAVGKDKEQYSWSGVLNPLVSFLGAFLPWTPATGYALWRIWKHPAPDLTPRRLERFLFCAFFGGLVLFSLSPHQRSRLITPLLPLAALLTGREMARLLRSRSKKTILRIALGCSLLYLGAVAVGDYFISPRNRYARQTLEVRQIAQTVLNSRDNPFPLTHAGGPFVFQLYLKTFRPYATLEQAAELLKGKPAVFVAVTDPARLRTLLDSNAPAIYELAHCDPAEKPLLSIVSNRPGWEEGTTNVLMIGDLKIEMAEARLIKERDDEFTFSITSNGARIDLWNLSTLPRNLRVKINDGGNVHSGSRQLAPGEKWEIHSGQNLSTR
ncbi:MAG: hypothetical protein ABJC04_00415, partial [Verrucomicrobiota bacterium]